jgi:hypothetical protein
LAEREPAIYMRKSQKTPEFLLAWISHANLAKGRHSWHN